MKAADIKREAQRIQAKHDGLRNGIPAIKVGVIEVIMPAGTYWLGDPCYSVKREDWSDWLDAAWERNGSDGNAHAILCAQVPSGAWVLGMPTAYGDGCYADNRGFYYGVDAGLIGLVPVDYSPTTNYKLDDKGKNEYGAEIAQKVTFDEPVTCRMRNGTLVFGDIRIETGGE